MGETVTIKEVTRKPNGWVDIHLEGDTRVLSTNEVQLADVAQAASGGTADVTVRTVDKGNFTNHYVQEINGVRSTPPKGFKATSGSATSAPRATSGRSPETQADIAKQWAIGRAVELLMASDVDFGFPLSDPMLKALKEQAQALLSARGDLKV